jgi:hypothetical protein
MKNRHKPINLAIRIIEKLFHETKSIRGKSMLLSAQMYLQEQQREHAK